MQFRFQVFPIISESANDMNEIQLVSLHNTPLVNILQCNSCTRTHNYFHWAPRSCTSRNTAMNYFEKNFEFSHKQNITISVATVQCSRHKIKPCCFSLAHCEAHKGKRLWNAAGPAGLDRVSVVLAGVKLRGALSLFWKSGLKLTTPSATVMRGTPVWWNQHYTYQTIWHCRRMLWLYFYHFLLL